MMRLSSDDSSSLTVQLAPPPPTSEDARRFNVPYPAIHRLNDDILLGIFDCYRLDEKNGWNVRLGWCKLSHVCQRWRHLIYEYSSYLDMQIECTTGAPIADTLDHLPPLPLIINYRSTIGRTEQDELAVCHALQLHGRVRHIELRVSLSPSILHKALALMDGNFPILEHLYLRYHSDFLGDIAFRVLSLSLGPFWPQIYDISLLLALIFQKDCSCSPPQSPLSNSRSATSKLLVTFARGF